MKELHALVDFENVQPSLEDLARLAPGFTDVWLFHGPHQSRPARQLAASHGRVTLVPHTGRGKNALDFHLSFYLGYVAAKHPQAQLVVVANDKGYDSMIGHARVLGFTARRVGFKARKAVVKRAAKKTTPAARSTPARKAAPQKPAPASKAPAKKPVTRQAPARKAPARNAAAQKSPPAKVPAKKPAAKTAARAKKAAAPKAVVSVQANELERIKKGLAKMGNKRPHKLKPLLRHLASMLGQDSTPAEVAALLKTLERENAVHITGDAVRYGAG